MKSRLVLKRLISVCLCATLFALFAPTIRAEGPIELSFSVFFPPTHPHAVASIEMAKEIEKRTNGQVKITVFPGGTLTKPQACYDGVVDGISDMGHSVFSYTRGRFPLMEALDLPLGYPNGAVASKVAYEYYKQINPKELQDVKVLTIHAHGPGVLASKKDVNTLEEMKGLKIRCTGLSAKLAEYLGAAAVAMPQNAAYEALQKGVVEGTFCPIETLKGWKQGEVIDYVIESKALGYTSTMFVVMNKEKYDSLPPDVQKVFDEVGAEWVDVYGRIWDDADQAGRQFVEGLGKTIHALIPEEEQKWEQAVQPVIDEYTKDVEQKGLSGADAVKAIQDLIATFSAK